MVSKMSSYNIFLILTLPTLLSAFFVGGILGLGGLHFQRLFRNELAGPFTLGVSSSATLGVALANSLNIEIWFFDAFSGALFSIFTLLVLQKILLKKQNHSLIVMGLVLSTLYSGLTLFIQFYSSEWNIINLFHWTMGNLNTIGFEALIPLVILSIIFLSYSLYLSKKMDLFELGDLIAKSKGLNISIHEKIIFITTSIFVALTISYAGPIGFIGLIAPHLIYRILPAKSSFRIIGSFTSGALLLSTCYLISHQFSADFNLPIGLITSTFGSLVFLGIALKKS